MNNVVLILLMASSMNVVAYGQARTKNNVTKTTTTMDTSKLNNSTVKAAFDAWQAGDATKWLSFFTPDAKLYDDGSARDFRRFVKEACGHERFTSIDKVEDDGKLIYGKFHTESWGDFKTYFKFHLNTDGKVDRLDIGQAN
ncbi:hypothetical protein GCM10028807_46430 [Spirosoma daeguense]